LIFRSKEIVMRRMTIVLLSGLLVTLQPAIASAHCDALDGPVVKSARVALDSRDVTKVLPWVAPDREPEVRAAFERALRVRQGGGDAQALADTWFYETVVRIHRAGEGAPFDGLKPAGHIEPLVAAVDQTLERGTVDELLAKVTAHVSSSVRERFERTREAQAHARDSVDAGRRFVAAYVDYVHHVEAVHRAASGISAEHEAVTAAAAGHQHPH
jgi:hypothetical protein